MRSSIVTGFVATIVWATYSVADGADRVALVIGNGACRSEAQLPNSANDPRDVSAGLAQHGFDVTRLIELGHQDMSNAPSNFRRKLPHPD